MRKSLVMLSVSLLGLGLAATAVLRGDSSQPADLDSRQNSKQAGGKTAAAQSDPGSLEVLKGDELTAMVGRLDQLKPGLERNRAVAQLAKGGDTTTGEIQRQMTQRSDDFGWVHTSVRVLEQINTEQSRTLLRQIAMGKTGSAANLQAWAAQALLKCDEKQALGLLSSETDDVIAAALLSLQGQGLDQDLMDALKPHIKSENLHLRATTAMIMASEAPAGELAEQALEHIKTALTAVATIPDLDKTDPSSGRVNYQMTVEEANYQRFLFLLPMVKAGNEALLELADELKGRARDTVLLALALRGEPKVHDEIVRLLKDPDAGMFRAWAASAMLRIYRADDLPLLKKIAKTDPLERGGGGDVLPRRTSQYPVRESAQQTVKAIERAIEKK